MRAYQFLWSRMAMHLIIPNTQTVNLETIRFLRKNFPWVYGKCNLNILGYGEKKIDNNENDSKQNYIFIFNSYFII